MDLGQTDDRPVGIVPQRFVCRCRYGGKFHQPDSRVLFGIVDALFEGCHAVLFHICQLVYERDLRVLVFAVADAALLEPYEEHSRVLAFAFVLVLLFTQVGIFEFAERTSQFRRVFADARRTPGSDIVLGHFSSCGRLICEIALPVAVHARHQAVPVVGLHLHVAQRHLRVVMQRVDVVSRVQFTVGIVARDCPNDLAARFVAPAENLLETVGQLICAVFVVDDVLAERGALVEHIHSDIGLCIEVKPCQKRCCDALVYISGLDCCQTGLFRKLRQGGLEQFLDMVEQLLVGRARFQLLLVDGSVDGATAEKVQSA